MTKYSHLDYQDTDDSAFDEWENDEYCSFQKFSHKTKVVRQDKDAAIKAKRKEKREREQAVDFFGL